MKKAFCIVLAIIVAVSACIAGCMITDKSKTDYLRIHIRANSNTQIDQDIKYKVKNSVVEKISPLITNIQSFDDACTIVSNNLSVIEQAADATLAENGFNYKSRARLCKEEFPTRSYENLTLSSGVYDALIIELGEGVGDNWWCVVFPPLCFVSSDGSAKSGKDTHNIKYKSFFAELIEKAKNKS